jgi:hypothetical protein
MRYINAGISAMRTTKAWYLPKWLDRILPNVDVEGESLLRARQPARELVDA